MPDTPLPTHDNLALQLAPLLPEPTPAPAPYPLLAQMIVEAKRNLPPTGRQGNGQGRTDPNAPETPLFGFD